MATAVSQGATGNPYIDGLLFGTKWNGSFTFSFPQSVTDYQAGNGETATFSPVSFAQREATRGILFGTDFVGNSYMTSVNSFVGVSVTEAGGLGNGLNGTGDIRLGTSSSANPTAYAYYPNNNANGNGGDVWFGTSYDYTSPVVGNYSYHTIIHELGHAMGLKHSQELGGVSNVAVPSDRDAIEFTVMSYRSYVGGPTSGYTYGTFSAPQTMMMLDIQALQTMYGAYYGSLSNNTNTTYTWSSTTGQMFINGVGQAAPGGNKVFLTIWDGGGIDTYDMSNYTNDVTIDLAPGSWSITSDAQRADLGAGQQANGTVYNALLFNNNLASIIENAVGGSGNDSITGNQVANTLSGNNGNDTISGLDGDDTLNGGSGTDTLKGGGGADTLNGGDDNDTLKGGGGADALNGGAGIDTADYAFSSAINVNLNTNSAFGGDAAGDTFSSIENVSGTTEGDIITGNSADNTLNGGSGNDALYGGIGEDTLNGGDDADSLQGGFGTDNVNGGNGDDTITVLEGEFIDNVDGGAGTDTLDLSNVDGTSGSGAITVDTAAGTWNMAVNFGGPATISGIERIIATQLADTISGSGLTFVDGQGGDDTISSDGGGGTYNGGSGNDYMSSGLGGETMDGGIGTDTIDHTIWDFTYIFDMATGLTNFFGELYTNFEIALMGDGDDTITGKSGFEQIFAGVGNDLIIAGDTSFGENDYWDGGSGTDRMSFQNFNWGAPSPEVEFDLEANTAEYNGFIETIINIEDFTGSDGNENIYGAESEANDLDGLGGNDNIDGRSGNDNLDGGDGNDVLRGGAGLDTFVGGNGDDSFYVDNSSETVTEGIGGGNDTVFTNQTYALAAGQEIENLRTNNQAGTLGLGLIGNEFNNFLTANAGNNTLNGGAGADEMRGLGGNDQYFVDNALDKVFELVGNGNDTVLTSITYTLANGNEIETFKTTNDAGTDNLNLTGNEFNNSMTGNAGNNTLNGGLGADTMRGLGGNDNFVVDNAGDVVIELAGNGTDTVFTSVSHALQSGQEIENLRTNNQAAVVAIDLTGNNLVNNIQGNNGDNVINGGGGIDTMLGFAGNDTYIVDNAGDIVNETAGNGADTVRTSVSYALQAGREIEFLQTTSAGALTPLVLTGNEFAQTITGNAGDNTLNGKQGNDTLTGGNGLDSFVFDTTLGAGNVDTITSFITADDTIVLENAIFAALGVGALAAGAFNVGAAATQADDRIIFNNVTKALLYDADGAGGAAAIQFASFTNIGGALSAADFSVI